MADDKVRKKAKSLLKKPEYKWINDVYALFGRKSRDRAALIVAQDILSKERSRAAPQKAA